MSQLQIEANICEVDGNYFQVRLYNVPRVGELINLFSYVNQANGLPPTKHYEVVQVVHELRDVSDNIPQSKDGRHFISVFVKPASITRLLGM